LPYRNNERRRTLSAAFPEVSGLSLSPEWSRDTERTAETMVLSAKQFAVEVIMGRDTKETTENTRGADRGRRDKGDKGREKVDESKGDGYQVPNSEPGTSRDAVKEDR
jgi:hypothetical protein